MKRKLFFSLPIVLLLAIINCGDNNDLGTNPEDTLRVGSSSNTFLLSDNSYILSESTLQNIESVSIKHEQEYINEIVFYKNSEQIEQLKIDDIVIGPPSKNNPDGFMQKIITIEQKGGKIILLTKYTSIDDAFDQLYLEKTLTANDIKEQTIQDGVLFKPSSKEWEISWGEEISKSYAYYLFGGKSYTYFIKASGNITLEPSIKVVIEKKSKTQSAYFLFEGNLDIFNDFDFSANMNKYISPNEKELLKPLKYSIPVSPIWINVEFSVVGDITGSIYGSISNIGYTLDNSYVNCSLKYNNKWSVEATGSGNVTIKKPNFSGTIDCKAYIGPKIKVYPASDYLAYGAVTLPYYVKTMCTMNNKKANATVCYGVDCILEGSIISTLKYKTNPPITVVSEKYKTFSK